MEPSADLATWFQETAEYAVGRRDLSWLLVDHPSQRLYDRTGFFDRLATRLGVGPTVGHGSGGQGVEHVVARPSMSLTKNALWSLTDLALTIRGSVGNELPSGGIPAVQGGWSEWSHIGLGPRADSEDEYWGLLEDSLGRLAEGSMVMEPEQVDRARLWQWLYRAAADVASPFIPHEEVLKTEHGWSGLAATLRHVEPEADPLFTRVAQMWRNKSSVLTRFDLDDDEALRAAVLPHANDSPRLADVRSSRPGDLFDSFDSTADPRRSHLAPGTELRSGRDDRLVWTDWFVRGKAVVGRVRRPGAVLGFDAQPGVRRLVFTFRNDATTAKWWFDRVHPDGQEIVPEERRVGHPRLSVDHPEGRPGVAEGEGPRLLVVREGVGKDVWVGAALVASPAQRGQTANVSLVYLPTERQSLAVELLEPNRSDAVRTLGIPRNGIVGLQLDSVSAEDFVPEPLRTFPTSAADLERCGLVSTGTSTHALSIDEPRPLIAGALVIQPSDVWRGLDLVLATAAGADAGPGEEPRWRLRHRCRERGTPALVAAPARLTAAEVLSGRPVDASLVQMQDQYRLRVGDFEEPTLVLIPQRSLERVGSGRASPGGAWQSAIATWLLVGALPR